MYQVVDLQSNKIVFQSEQWNEVTFFIAESSIKIMDSQRYYDNINNTKTMEEMNSYSLILGFIVIQENQ